MNGSESGGGTPGTGRGDHEAGMRATRVIPDHVIEAIVDDQPVDATFAQLVAFAGHVRAVGDGPVPRPSEELVALLEGRIKPVLGTADAPHLLAATTRSGALTGPATKRLASFASKVAGLGLAAKIGLGTSLAAASIAGAGAAGVLPAAANDTVRHAIDAVSPIELFGASDEPASAEDGVRPDAAGENEGDDTGEGHGTADDAPGADSGADPAVADEPPGQSGETGLTRANQTPAEPHAPDTTPAATAPSTIPPKGSPAEPGQPNPPRSAPSTVPPHGDQADDHRTGE